MFLATSTGGTILITVVSFLVLLMVLVALLLFTKEKLSPSGPVTITINGEKKIEVGSGSSLLSTLGNQKVFLPSACGGGEVLVFSVNVMYSEEVVVKRYPLKRRIFLNES